MKCSLCKVAITKYDSIKLGKDKICKDRIACYERIDLWPEKYTGISTKLSEK